VAAAGRLILSVLLAPLALACATPALAYHPNVYGRHWPGIGPERRGLPTIIEMVTGERIVPVANCVEGTAWEPHIRAEAAEWSQSRYLYLPIVPCGSASTKIRVVEVYRTEVSWTDMTWYTGKPRLSRVRIDLNTYRGPNLHTACHALGHAIGLGHRNELTSCMKPV